MRTSRSDGLARSYDASIPDGEESLRVVADHYIVGRIQLGTDAVNCNRSDRSISDIDKETAINIPVRL